MSRPERLTTTSYAILGLLALRPWSTYELTREMEWSFGRIWPRATSKLYEEPKKLERLGLARARREQVGKRPRTMYSITPTGRRSLAEWLASDMESGLTLEAEPLLRLFLADRGTRDDALATIVAAKEWARERNAGNLAAGRAFLAGEGRFDERAAVTMLTGAFLTDFYKLVADWSDWAAEQVAGWPERPADAVPDRDELRRIVARAEWSETT